MLGQAILSDNEQSFLSLRTPENKSSGTVRVPKSQRKKRAVAETPMYLQESMISDSTLLTPDKRRTRSQRKNVNPVDNKLSCFTAKVLE